MTEMLNMLEAAGLITKTIVADADYALAICDR